MTAKTAAERQAERRARIQTTLDDQSAALTRLVEENAALRAENDAMKAKLHQLEIAGLKAKLKAAKSVS